jgi:glycosyltransferase involved in cell wall biosynthesis
MASEQHSRRLIYIVTEDWFFFTHFIPMARAAQNAGFEVIVVTSVGDRASEIRNHGMRIIDLPANRSSFGPGSLFVTLWRLRSVLARERPDVIHAIALKSVILGGIANLLRGGGPGVFSLTGLGYLWSGNTPLLRTSRATVRMALSLLSLKESTVFTFENEDDASEFASLKRKIVIGGWGMELDAQPSRELAQPDLPVSVVYLGRMLKAKGIEATVEAVQLARQVTNVRLDLWGTPDPGNLTSLTSDELLELSELEGIKWHGWAADISGIWQRADIAILLSTREGMPRSLIEAAAAGLPMIAFDVAGCRSIVRNGVNGFLVPPGDIRAVADAIVKLAGDAELRRQMGFAARADFEQKFSTGCILPKIMGIYLNLVRYSQMS